jgi:hypothetical protein
MTGIENHHTRNARARSMAAFGLGSRFAGCGGFGGIKLGGLKEVINDNVDNGCLFTILLL